MRASGTGVSGEAHGTNPRETLITDPQAEEAARRLIAGKTGFPLIDQLDVDTARSLEILVAAGEIAAMNPRKPPRRWNDPIMVALVLFGCALVGLGFGLNALAGVIHQSGAQRRVQIGNLTTQVEGLEQQIGTLSALAKENADNLAADARRITQLEHENAHLVRLVQRLCAVNPNNARCVRQLNTTITPGAPAAQVVPQTTVPSQGVSTSAPAPTAPSAAPHPPVATPTVTPTPTPRLTLPTICLSPPLPCI